jgi:glycine cleavage system aminomethyltransferase T
MPHWDGVIDTSSPQVLEASKGDPPSVREQLLALAPQGANVRSVSWEAGKDVARVRVEGPKAEEFLKSLDARDVVQLMSAHERKAERD